MMNLKLVDNAGRIARRAYSMWANYLGILCLIAPEIIFRVWEIDTNPRFWWYLGLGLIVFGILGRILDQGIDRSKMQSSAAAFLIVAIPLISQWEGLENHAYLDRIAKPPVWTVCHGETNGVKQGDHYTDEQCAQMLGERLLEYRDGLHGYFTTETIAGRLTPERDAAYVSLAYNVGIRGAGRSTATRRLNAGNIAGGCEALTWWNRAGGRVVRGLVRRRAAEYRLCMAGLA